MAAEATDSPLNAPLPARWGPLQRWKNTLLYGLMRVGFWVLSHIPFTPSALVAEGLASLAPWFAWADARRAREHLAQAFPELSASERRVLTRRMFRHFARSTVELAHLDRFLRGKDAVRMSEETRKVFDDALSGGGGTIVVTGHIGNWELLAQAVAFHGLPATCIAKPLYDPRLTRWVHTLRSRHGLELIWRGDATGWRAMLGAFRKGRILALLIDQDTRVPGVFVPFFGRLADTPSGAASLALRKKVPVVVTWIHRTESGHQIHAERLTFEPTGEQDADVESLTAKLTGRLEAAIREYPEQWVWLHKRWKTRPPEESHRSAEEARPG